MNSKEKFENILCETIDLGSFFFLVFEKKNTKVFLMDSVDFYDNHTLDKTIYERILGLIRKDMSIVRVPQLISNNKSTNDIWWDANKKSLEYFDSDIYSKIFLKLKFIFTNDIEETALDLAFKKIMLPIVYKKILFIQTFKILKANELNKLKVFESHYDFLDIKTYLGIESDLVFIKSKLSSIWNFLKSTIFLISSPFLVRILFQRGVSFRSITPESYDVAIPLVFGFFRESELKSNIFDNEFIKSSKIDPSKFLFIEKNKHGRNTSNKDFNELRKYAKKVGTNIVHEKKLKIPIVIFFKKFISYAFIKNFRLLKLFLFKDISFVGLKEIQRLISMLILEELFLAYFRTKIFISRDDYDAQHIIRTASQNKHGLLNVGIQHSAFIEPKYLPFQAWPYFDRYYIQADDFINLWSPYFSHNKSLLSIGTQRDFKILEALRDQSIKAKFEKKYSFSTNILMIITSPSKTYSPEWLIKKKYKNFWKILDIDPNLKLILRPRNVQAKESFISLFPEINNYLESGKIIFEEKDFTTQQLLAYCDIFISEDSSSSILETAHFNHIYLLSINMRYPMNHLLKGVLFENFEEIGRQLKKYLVNKRIPENNKKTIEKLKSSYTLPPGKSAYIRLVDDLYDNLIN